VSAVLATNLFGAIAPEFFGDLGASLFTLLVVNAMQSQVTEDLKDAREAHTQLILDEVRALRQQIAALRQPSSLPPRGHE